MNRKTIMTAVCIFMSFALRASADIGGTGINPAYFNQGNLVGIVPDNSICSFKESKEDCFNDKLWAAVCDKKKFEKLLSKKQDHFKINPQIMNLGYMVEAGSSNQDCVSDLLDQGLDANYCSTSEDFLFKSAPPLWYVTGVLGNTSSYSLDDLTSMTNLLLAHGADLNAIHTWTGEPAIKNTTLLDEIDHQISEYIEHSDINIGGGWRITLLQSYRAFLVSKGAKKASELGEEKHLTCTQ